MFPWSKLQPGLLPIFSWIFFNETNLSINPDIIISCGRKSVYLSIYFKSKYKNAISVHIQNPKINFKKFDYIIAPNHDGIKGENIIESIGALHKFDEKEFKNIVDNNFNIPKNNLISLVIGGSNNHYRFSLEETKDLINRIKNIKNLNSTYNFLILFSRRTTNKMKSLITKELSNLGIIWNEKDKNPYTFALKYSDFFIVTSDSTSMISECAFTEKPIYVFHLPFKRKSKRIEKFHNKFQELNITKILDSEVELFSWKYNSLNESKRIAGILKERIIKDNS